MTTLADKAAAVSMCVDGQSIKLQAGKDACVGDTGELTASNVLAVLRVNGSDSASTGNKRAPVLLIGETAPTGKYAGAAPGSLFILTGAATGALYVKVDATTWTATI